MEGSILCRRHVPVIGVKDMLYGQGWIKALPFFFASMPFDDSSGSNKDCFEMIKSIQGSSWNALTRVAPSSHLVCDLKGQADKDSSTDPRGKVSILQSIEKEKEIYFLWGRSPEAV
jgi:hypothetical protein